jgi:ribosomal-protein-serine acetyltransferase
MTSTTRRLKQAPPSVLYVDDLIIRKYEVDDARAVMESVTESREHLRPWMPWIQFEPLDVHARRKLIREWDQSWANAEDFPMGIFRDGLLIGGTGFHLRGPEGSVDIGYWLHRDAVGQRVVSRSVRALLDTAFGLEEITHVFITHDRANVASGHVPERVGFTLVETSERQKEAPGEEGVLMRWEMTRDNWFNIRGELTE